MAAAIDAEIATGSSPRRPWWREPPVWATAGLAALVWLVRFASRFGLHLDRPPQWAGWHDQARYITSARALAALDFAPAQHWYPLAYSMIAAPFVAILPNEPFFVPDLVLFVLAVIGFQRAMRPLGLTPWAATLLFLLADMTPGPIARLWTEPWTTSLSATLIWGLIAHIVGTVIDVPEERRVAPPTARAMLALGLFAGALPLVRPAEVTSFIAIAFAGILLWRQRRLTIAGIGWALLGGLLLCVPYALLYLAIYGLQITAYVRVSANFGFVFADLPWKAYVILVSARPWFPDTYSLIEKMPWLVPGVAGLIVAGWTMDRPARWTLALIGLIALPYCLIFIAYSDLQPPGLWTYANAHYFKWLFPLSGAGTWFWLRSFATRRGAARGVGVLALVVVPMLARPLPAAVGEDAPARMLMFRGDTTRNWDKAYFAPATITDGRGLQHNILRFHQIPDAYGERALAISRLFVGPAVRDDPGELPAFAAHEKPYARYAVRLSFGIPCWFAHQQACRIPPLPA